MGIEMNKEEKKFDVIFVIQGKEFSININVNQKIKATVHKALQQAGVAGSTEGWELRTESGDIIDINASYKDQNITEPTKLFLSKGAGRGGFSS